jgi:CHASE3 domain sensor protein
MFVDVGAEFRRPVPLALAIVAGLGWLLALALWWSASTARASYEERIRGLEIARQSLAAELEEQRRAAGTVAELRRRAADARDTFNRAFQERERAQAQLATLQKDAQTTSQTLAGRQASSGAERALVAAVIPFRDDAVGKVLTL